MRLSNLGWELAQIPFYTLWTTGTPEGMAFAILHCTAGDLMIGIGVWAITRMLLGRLGVQPATAWLFPICFVVFSVAYTVFSEWWNVHVTGSWAYAAWMPLLPPFGTGLTPLLQWTIVPTLTWLAAGNCTRAKLVGPIRDIEGLVS